MENVNSAADIALSKKTEWLRALEAIACGYPVRGEEDRYVVVENPYYQDNIDIGANPNIVIDVEEVRAIVRALAG